MISSLVLFKVADVVLVMPNFSTTSITKTSYPSLTTNKTSHPTFTTRTFHPILMTRTSHPTSTTRTAHPILTNFNNQGIPYNIKKKKRTSHSTFSLIIFSGQRTWCSEISTLLLSPNSHYKLR